MMSDPFPSDEARLAAIRAACDSNGEAVLLLTPDARWLLDRIDALAKFKTWVHDWLDAQGVPHDPEPENTARHGCRISGRMRWLVDRLAAAERERWAAFFDRAAGWAATEMLLENKENIPAECWVAGALQRAAVRLRSNDDTLTPPEPPPPPAGP